ncbi:methyl-accepting chemotaxis protein [Alteromonas oceanisediminis]|uniref:methyl-accepting chemotaxis protein n=1 Tax=Alteromonas oceanisediminis TaxID=2836180 RepID=UPI001BDA0A5E|nr:methyl-accepting chemotaxis protein [Alteromonas oceanisediminis]MBT0585231.1 methyl-accepting chemotaxis protein [Alteromonas oceanisediminis]
MRITVAMRIIGGFAIITLLLLIISWSSLSNLNSIQEQTEKVNQIAIPAVAGSNSLKASFLNMGRLTFESYYEPTLDGLDEKKAGFTTSRENFVEELQILQQVVSGDDELRTALASVSNTFNEYTDNVESMYANHRKELELRNQTQSRIGDLEDNADDASSLILDFSDLDAVQSSDSLSRAAEIGSRIETNLLSLVTVAIEYAKTTTLQRSQTLGNEVDIVVSQVAEQLSNMQQAEGGRDSSGTMSEISELISAATSAITANDGVLALHVERLESDIAARKSLSLSDENIQTGIEELNALLALADEKVKTTEKSVNKSVNSANTQIWVIIVISLIISAAIAYLTVRAITVPLRKVNELLNIAASGDLTHKLDQSSKDEFGELARNCNNLINSLTGLISGIRTRAEQLAAASEQTSTVTTQTTASIQDQKSQIAQVATATTEMHSTSQLVTQSAEDTLAQIRHADSEAQNVRSISLENKRTIEVLASDVQEAADVINKLHQDSASIGGILDVIRGVADQTNLLALNAAIEAARAGEQGRGFAVVADEVRTLASRTQESTQEINAMIEVLQAGAEKAVAVMNQGKEQTSVCVEQTDKATKALDLISDAVHKAHDVSSQIEQSAREQNVVSQEISERLESIVGIAEETTIGAQQTSESSHEVARLAEELQQSIQQFKV